MTRLAILAPFALILSAACAAADPSAACRELLSGQRMTLAVPNSPGGGYDTYARSLAPAIETHGGLTVRVTNMPGGGGLAARGFVMNAAPDELAVLIENAADLAIAPVGNLGRGAQADKDILLDAYEIVGILHSEPATWLARAGLDVADPDLGPLVAAEGSLTEALLPILIAGAVLGIEMDVVTGYDGTGEMAAAILRGEADISSMSATTAARRAQDEELEVVLALSEGPFTGAPDLPYLAGPGSLVWDLTAELPEGEAAERRRLASAVARLRTVPRGLFVSTNMTEDRRACVAEVMDAALADPDFVATAAAQGRPVAAQTAAEARAFADGLRSAFADARPTLLAITADIMSD